MAEVASAYVSLIPSFKGGASSITRQTDAAARTSGKRFGSIFSGSLKSVIGGALAGAGITRLLSDSLGEAREAQKVGALTNQVLKSTGGAANVTAKHVGDLATAISNKVGVDDEAIQSGENLLLTFKNVRNEAGKGNDIFDQATHSLVDLAAGMAAASGGELNFRSSTTLVGKALNDPIKGLSALARVGVTFTKGQQDQIKALVGSGKQMQAQKIILKELKSEFGGAAKAQATDADKAQVAIKNLEEQIGTALLPVVDDLAQKVTKDVVPAVSKFITQMQDGTGAGGEFVDDLKEIVSTGKSIVEFFVGLPGPVKKYGAELIIASVAVGKLNSGLGGLFGNMTRVEGESSRFARTMQGVGAGIRNVAGAGGLVLLADSADEAGTKMGALKAISGGALSGAALGAFAGPPGAAVGAAIGGIAGAAFQLAEEVHSTGAEASYAFPKLDEYAKTLGGVGAATTAATRAMALERLQKSGLLTQTEALNISDRDAVQAALGNEAARKRVSAALAQATSEGKNYQALKVSEHLGIETNALYASRVAQLKKNLALAATKAEAEKIQAKLDKLARTNATARVTIGGADTAIQKLNAVLQLMHDVTSAKGGIKGKTGGVGALLTPRFGGATGAIITKPTIALIGESGPERLQPLNTAPGASPLPATGVSSVDAEQVSYRAFSRALRDGGMVVVSRDRLSAMDLAGAM